MYVGLGYHLKKTHDKPGQQFIQATWTKHPNYDPYNSDNDIAFLHLDTPATLNDKVQTIKISSSQPSVGTDLLVSGWGRTHGRFVSFKEPALRVVQREGRVVAERLKAPD